MVRLKEVRTAHNMTQAALSEKSGVNRVSIAKYESGKTEPSLETARKLADALGVTVNDLLDAG